MKDSQHERANVLVIVINGEPSDPFDSFIKWSLLSKEKADEIQRNDKEHVLTFSTLSKIRRFNGFLKQIEPTAVRLGVELKGDALFELGAAYRAAYEILEAEE